MSFFEFPHTRTYDSDLGWIIKQINAFMACCESMKEWKEKHEKEYQELKALYDAILSGNFPPALSNAFQKWMNENALDLVGEMVKCVFFEISLEGYFIAWIPDSWYDIIFNTTGLDITLALMPDYGHLVLSY